MVPAAELASFVQPPMLRNGEASLVAEKCWDRTAPTGSPCAPGMDLRQSLEAAVERPDEAAHACWAARCASVNVSSLWTRRSA